jgi:cephalosporin hydroxylase
MAASSPFARPQNWFTRALDRWAARRVMRAIIGQTNNMFTVRWLGQQIWQFPMDAWVMQEVISELRPDLIIETGTFRGGSAYYYGCLCELLGHGHVVSIDVAAEATIPHARVTYITGSSVDPAVVQQVQALVDRLGAQQILVVLDSDHSAAHVLEEMQLYSAFVPMGGRMLVQDGCIDEYSVFAIDRPGPKVAIQKFLTQRSDLVRDTELEHRYMVTFHPWGWLQRVAPDPKSISRPSQLTH